MYNRNPQVVIVLLVCAASSRSEEGARGRQQEAKLGESTSKTCEELCLLASHMHLDWVIRNQLRTVMLSEFAKI